MSPAYECYHMGSSWVGIIGKWNFEMGKTFNNDPLRTWGGSIGRVPAWCARSLGFHLQYCTNQKLGVGYTLLSQQLGRLSQEEGHESLGTGQSYLSKGDTESTVQEVGSL